MIHQIFDLSRLQSCWRALEESAELARSHKQKLPETIEREDLLSYDMMVEFEVLRSRAPLLYNVVVGAMGLKKDQLKVKMKLTTCIIEFFWQDPSHFLPGGTCGKVSLKPAIVQVMSQCHVVAHPRSRSLQSIMNGTYGVIKHMDESFMRLHNTSGTMVSRKSANKVVDKFVQGMNKVIILNFHPPDSNRVNFEFIVGEH